MSREAAAPRSSGAGAILAHGHRIKALIWINKPCLKPAELVVGTSPADDGRPATTMGYGMRPSFGFCAASVLIGSLGWWSPASSAQAVLHLSRTTVPFAYVSQHSPSP